MAKSIMIQGTMSNAGKSIIAAGLCRIFTQDGYKTAPFKSQNMALNSFITNEGLEMGRAQAVQAEACKIEPSVNMNPILLKPVTDMGSQVIVMGEVIGNMKAMDYFKKKKEYISVIKEAYESLSRNNDIIVIEGAGSPAEINLKKDDIVNMGMAKMVKSPVILVGDIDRGGVFAQLMGTIMLLEREEQEIIKGLIINKFRGDKKILEPGLDMLRELCGKDILGVVPYSNIDIEDEDSLSQRLASKSIKGKVDIAVIRLPKISNFTDFYSLEMNELVSVRYVESADELKSPDAIIIPGTKSTMRDLLWLRENGLEASVKRLAQRGTVIMGICGGYQMLGNYIEDVYGVENTGNLMGMGLLDMTTYFEKEKTRTRTEGVTLNIKGELSPLSGKKVSGYEIHMGMSIPSEGTISFIKTEEKKDGIVQGNILGTYIHGIFDEEDFRNAFVNMLCKRRGIEYNPNGLSYKEYKEQQYNKLADILRESLDMNEIYGIIREGI